MQQLRKAGKALQNFDEMYAAKVAEDMGGAHKSPAQVNFGGSPLNSIGYDGAETIKDHLIGGSYAALTAGTNIGYRYGLPAAGLTLAGKGLYDLTAAFGNAADQPAPNELDPGSAAVGATAGGLSTAALAGGAYMMGMQEGEDEARYRTVRF